MSDTEYGTGDVADDPMLPIDVRAIRAYYRGKRKGLDLHDLRMRVREHVGWNELDKAMALLDSMLRQVDTGNPARREPEANINVYELGHYEQMQLAIALGWIVDPDEPPQEPDIATLRGLQRLFASHGTVTVIRHEAE